MRHPEVPNNPLGADPVRLTNEMGLEVAYRLDPKKKITRREFLRGVLFGLGAAALAGDGSGCAPVTPVITLPVEPKSTATNPATASPTSSISPKETNLPPQEISPIFPAENEIKGKFISAEIIKPDKITNVKIADNISQMNFSALTLARDNYPDRDVLASTTDFNVIQVTTDKQEILYYPTMTVKNDNGSLVMMIKPANNDLGVELIELQTQATDKNINLVNTKNTNKTILSVNKNKTSYLATPEADRSSLQFNFSPYGSDKTNLKVDIKSETKADGFFNIALTEPISVDPNPGPPDYDKDLATTEDSPVSPEWKTLFDNEALNLLERLYRQQNQADWEKNKLELTLTQDKRAQTLKQFQLNNHLFYFGSYNGKYDKESRYTIILYKKADNGNVTEVYWPGVTVGGGLKDRPNLSGILNKISVPELSKLAIVWNGLVPYLFTKTYSDKPTFCFNPSANQFSGEWIDYSINPDKLPSTTVGNFELVDGTGLLELDPNLLDKFRSYFLKALFISNRDLFTQKCGIKNLAELEIYVNSGNKLPEGLKFVVPFFNSVDSLNFIKLESVNNFTFDLKKLSILILPYEKYIRLQPDKMGKLFSPYGYLENKFNFNTPDGKTKIKDSTKIIGLGFRFTDKQILQLVVFQKIKTDAVNGNGFVNNKKNYSSENLNELNHLLSFIVYMQMASTFGAYVNLDISDAKILGGLGFIENLYFEFINRFPSDAVNGPLKIKE